MQIYAEPRKSLEIIGLASTPSVGTIKIKVLNTVAAIVTVFKVVSLGGNVVAKTQSEYG